MSNIQNLIKEYSTKKEQNIYNDILELIKKEETLWTVVSPVTKNYYLDYIKGSPSVFIFSDKEYAEVFKDYLMQQKIQVEIIENTADDRVTFFSDCFRSGRKSIVVDNGQSFLIAELSQIVELPDLKNVNSPVVNPSLVCAADRFFQNLAVKKVSRDMEEILICEIYNGKFIMPTLKADDDSQLTIVQITGSDNKKYIPIFTDWNEYYKFDTKKQFEGNVIDFSNIEYFCSNGELIIINILGFKMTIDKNTATIIKSTADGNKNFNTDNQMTIFDLDVVPKELVNGLNEYFKTVDKINSAYIRGIRKNETAGYLIIVDFDGKKEEIFAHIAEISKQYSENLPVDFAQYDSEFGKKAVGNASPFYEKIRF